MEPGHSEKGVDAARLAQAEQPAGQEGVARRQARVLQSRGDEDRQARILLGAREHHRANAAAGPQRAMNLAQPLQRIGKEHQPEATHRGIERGLGDAQIFAVGDPGLDMGEVGADGVVSRQRHDRRRQVGGEHVALRTHGLRHSKGLVPRPGRNVQDTSSRPDTGHAEHGVSRLV